MDVEIITDKVPTRGLGSSSDYRLHMRQKICLRARGACIGSHHLPGHHITTDNEGAGAVAKVLKLTSLHFSGNQRQSWVLALQGLDPGQFIRAHRPFSLFGQLWSLPIDLTDLPNGFLFVRIIRRGQPVADQMRFEIPFFNIRAAWRGEISLRIPRRLTSSAISRPVQWLMGRSRGCSQAIATIWQICSAVISEGRPGRGMSVSRSLTESSSRDTACKPIQRIRQLRTVSTLTPSSLAISAFLFPSAAPRIMRPRLASCWGVVCRRTSSSRSFRSSLLHSNSAGFGPFCISSLLPFFLPFYHRLISAAMY
jgi:hypothetical protein